MSLKIKSGVDLERLREFGFAPGYELAERPEYVEVFMTGGYPRHWWYKFGLDPDDPTRPELDDDDNPLSHAWVDTRKKTNRLWFDVMPCSVYQVGMMDDLDLITDTVFALTQAGLVEEVVRE